MAKTYKDVCPTAKMVVLDYGSSIGGVWAKERLYPGLKTNNLLGSYEFSDFPMSPGRFDVRPSQHIPGTAVHEYLQQYADHFGITPHLRFRQKVESAELKEDGKWTLSIYSLDSMGRILVMNTMVARKMVVATGLTSEPYVPDFAGQETFERPILHSRQFRAREKEVEAAKQVVIVGGNKSAWDACYWAASTGAHVDLVIRPSGGGPSWVWPAFFSPLKMSIQRLATTRVFTWFDPCIWTESDPYLWIQKSLHKTWIGKKVVNLFWRSLGSVVTSRNQYHAHPELQKLKPWISTFWMGNSLGIHNYDSDWFELVKKGRINVHVADVKSLSEGFIHLTNGTELPADALVCCTGWQAAPPIKFLPEGIATSLGLPGQRRPEQVTSTNKVRNELLEEFPTLRQAPTKTVPCEVATSYLSGRLRENHETGPYTLYRFVVPCHERFFQLRNIAFMGAHLAISAVPIAQVQALWIAAFFQNRIIHLQPENTNHEALSKETARHSEYCRIRRPPIAGGSGERCPDLVFECLPYIDMLLNDLGVNRFRKSSALKEIFSRYMPGDYKNLTQEWYAQEAREAAKRSV